MMRHAIAWGIGLLGLTVQIASAANAPLPLTQQPGINSEVAKNLKNMRPLPVEGFVVAEKNGTLVLMSTNGRYVMKGGEFLDMWNRTKMSTIVDVEKSFRVPFKSMQLLNFLQSIDLSQKKTGRDVLLFLDPTSPTGAEAIKLVRGLVDRYDFHIVIMSANGNEGANPQAFLCDKEQARKYFLGSGSPPKASSASCGKEGLEKNQVLAKLLVINRLPSTVASNGTVMAGVPKQYERFLSEHVE